MRIPGRLILMFAVVVSGGCGRGRDLFSSLVSRADFRPTGPFVARPYLQLGDAPAGGGSGNLRILWQAEDRDAAWGLEYRSGADQAWRAAGTPSMRRIALPGVPPHRVISASLEGLTPGATVSYRVSREGEVVFQAEAKALKGPGQAQRFVVFGDCGIGDDAQKAVAYQAHLARPDMVLITGDIVYDRGLASEYFAKFWPIYNADAATPGGGAPLLRSTPFVAAPGNHDIGTRNFDDYPDGLAYFYYWDQPRNGPPLREGDPNVPPLKGPVSSQEAFRRAAGESFPRMSNFAFDQGDVHWTILDANPYVDWGDPALQAWLERDLAGARGAKWRLVAYHQPAFNSARKHCDEQNMRRLAPVLEAGGVDVVFNGHVHNYQRTYPLRFVPDRPGGGKTTRHHELVPGRWTLDREYDGVRQTRPRGVIHVVTGAGGAPLYNPEQQDDPGTWQEYTCRFVSRVHSLTVADVDGVTLTIRQVSATGEELDRFVLTR